VIITAQISFLGCWWAYLFWQTATKQRLHACCCQ